MTNILSIPGVKVSQKDYHQIIIRGNGLEKFNNTIEEKTSIKPPSKNLEIKHDLNFLIRYYLNISLNHNNQNPLL